MAKILHSTVWFSMLLLTLSACKTDEVIDPIVEPEVFSVQAPAYFGQYNSRIPSNNSLSSAKFELGRKLFYENKLSGDESMSCGSCHQQSKAFTDGQAISAGIDGQFGQLSAMSLVNLLWVEKFTWNGNELSLEDQAVEPIRNPIELHGDFEEIIPKLENADYGRFFSEAFGDPEINQTRIGMALATFERALISANSKYDQYLLGTYQPTSQELRGEQLFYTHPVPGQLRGGNCGDCHLGPLTSGAIDGFSGFHNNGLDGDDQMDAGLYEVTANPKDSGKFKTPSLRNIALTAPYMHDGRFNTLREVLDHYDKGLKVSKTLDVLLIEGSNEQQEPGVHPQLFLTEQEKEDIIAFLHMLTDETFITNESFASPF